MNLFKKLFKPRPRMGKCSGCGATIMQRCLAYDCPNYLTRSQNAPKCYDTLHHYCALKPFCVGGCKNDQLKRTLSLLISDCNPTAHPMEPDGLGGTNGIADIPSGTSAMPYPGVGGAARTLSDPRAAARTLGAYALNVAYGGKLEPFELTHLTALAGTVGCTVTPRQQTDLTTRAVLDELLAERRNQITHGYTAEYDDQNPMHGRMETLQRLNDPNYTRAHLVEAAAIIVAEVERIDRLPAKPPASPPDPKLTHNGHVLYEQGDTDVPLAITDRNGDVVLAQCKVCGAAEIDLDTPCKGPLS